MQPKGFGLLRLTFSQTGNQGAYLDSSFLSISYWQKRQPGLEATGSDSQLGQAPDNA